MKGPMLLSVAALVVCGCAAKAPPVMWIPMDTATRASRHSSTVEFLDAPPLNPYTVIGIITPPDGFYETEAEAVHDMRIYAAEHGADAMFIESMTETSGWSFSVNGYGAGSGGSTGGTRYRAKAIVWVH